MRVHKYRGLRTPEDPGEKLEWVFGDLTQFAATQFTRAHTCVEGVIVDPATVGQFTGMHDKDGREIFEGDLLVITYYPKCTRIVRFGQYAPWGRGLGFWLEPTSGLEGVALSESLGRSVYLITGNIHTKEATNAAE